MKTPPRNIEAKTLMHAPEYSEFKETCRELDISQSRGLREGAKLLRGLLDSRNGMRCLGRAERPVCDNNQAMFLPGRHYSASSFASRSYYARN